MWFILGFTSLFWFMIFILKKITVSETCQNITWLTWWWWSLGKNTKWVSVGKTRKNNRWFKPFPNGRFIVVLPPFISIWDWSHRPLDTFSPPMGLCPRSHPSSLSMRWPGGANTRSEEGPTEWQQQGPELTWMINESPVSMPKCSMVLEYLPTFARTKSPSYVGKYTIHGAYGMGRTKDGNLDFYPEIYRVPWCYSPMNQELWESHGIIIPGADGHWHLRVARTLHRGSWGGFHHYLAEAKIGEFTGKHGTINRQNLWFNEITKILVSTYARNHFRILQKWQIKKPTHFTNYGWNVGLFRNVWNDASKGPRFWGCSWCFLSQEFTVPKSTTGRPGWHDPATSLKQSTGWWFQLNPSEKYYI